MAGSTDAIAPRPPMHFSPVNFLCVEESQNLSDSVTLNDGHEFFLPGTAAAPHYLQIDTGAKMMGDNFWSTFAVIIVVLAAGLFVTVTTHAALNAATLVADHDTCTHHACISVAANQ